MAGGIDLIRRHSPRPDDTSIGVLFVGFLALAGVIMSTQRASYTGDLNRFLFGSIVVLAGSGGTARRHPATHARPRLSAIWNQERQFAQRP